LERVLVVSSPGSRVVVRRGVVYVVSREGERVPVSSDVELLVLVAGAVSVSVRALRRLAELGVRVLVVGRRGMVVGEYRPVDRVNRTVESRLAQYRAKVEGWALLYAREMVVSKIVNQARVLRYLAKSRREPWLRDEAYAVEDYAVRLERLDRLSPDAVRGLEAQAARRYWSAIATLVPDWVGFPGRDPLGDDPLNKALSYGYAILYSLASDALIVAGLDPYAGFLHVDRSGRPSLVYDYSEMFKPVAVDRVLVQGLCEEMLETVHGVLSYRARGMIARMVLENMLQRYLDSQGRRRRLKDHLYAYAWSLASSLRSRGAYLGFRVRL